MTAAYDPDTYWHGRAPDLIARYGDLQNWIEMRDFHAREAELVSDLVSSLGIKDLLVAGCGTGRQFSYLDGLVPQLAGFDLVPAMVNAARRNYPHLPVACHSLLEIPKPHQAILAVTVLQHVPPDRIAEALRALCDAASEYLIFAELSYLDPALAAPHNFAHDYPALLPGQARLDLAFDFHQAPPPPTRRISTSTLYLAAFTSNSSPFTPKE